MRAPRPSEAQAPGTPSGSADLDDDRGEQVPDCTSVIARIEARLRFLDPLCDTNPAARTEAAALRPLVPAADGALPPVEDAASGCIACRMLAGDVNLDGHVDAEDIAAFLSAWADGDLPAADLNRDGWIDRDDLAIILRAMAAQAH